MSSGATPISRRKSLLYRSQLSGGSSKFSTFGTRILLHPVRHASDCWPAVLMQTCWMLGRFGGKAISK